MKLANLTIKNKDKQKILNEVEGLWDVGAPAAEIHDAIEAGITDFETYDFGSYPDPDLDGIDHRLEKINVVRKQMGKSELTERDLVSLVSEEKETILSELEWLEEISLEAHILWDALVSEKVDDSDFEDPYEVEGPLETINEVRKEMGLPEIEIEIQDLTK